MAVETTISPVTEKMQNLLARNEIMYLPKLRTRVNRSITSLEKFLEFLKDLKDGQDNTSTIKFSEDLNNWKTELRKAVYNTDNDIDDFRVRTALAKASPILYVMSLSDQFSLNNKMGKIARKLEEISGKLDNKGDSKIEKSGDPQPQRSAFKAGGEDTSEPNVPDGQSDQEQDKPSEDNGVPSSNDLRDSQLQQSEKSKDFGLDASEPNITNGRPESDQEQPKLPEDTGVQPADLSSNNSGDAGEITSEPNKSDGRPHQEKTKLPRDAESESREDVEYTSQQKVKSEIEEEVDDMVGQVVSDRNSMTSPPLERAPSFLGDETKNLPGKRFLQRSETMYLHDEREMVGLKDKLRELIGKEEKTVQHPKQEEVEAGKVLENVKPKKQEEKETNAALNEDQSNSLDQSVSEDLLDPLKILTLGSQELSSNLRECFHYMCLFPKWYEIRTRRLFRLLTAEGLVGDTNAAEDGERVIEDLEQRSMIEVLELRSDGKPKTCRVVDTVYDKFISDAADLGYHHIHGNSDSTSKSPKSNIRRFAKLLDPYDIRASNHLYLKDVRTFICFYNQKGNRPAKEVKYLIYNTSIRRGFGLLTVFDLEGVYKPVLPKTLGKVLPLLKYVSLRRTFLDSIPESVGNLQFLETLDVKHTNITKMPISIWETKELQHLYLGETPFEMSIRESSSCDYPTKLQTLCGLLIGNKDPPIVWLKRQSNIRKLGLTCHPETLENLTVWISKLSGLRSLRLRAVNEFNEPSGIHLGSMVTHEKLTDLYLLGKLPKAIDIKELPSNLTNLTLSVSKLLVDPMKMLGQLAELKILKLFADSYTGKDMTCVHDGFPKLKVLKLWMLKELEKWVIEQGTMPELKELEIRYCPKLLNKPEGLEYLTKAEVTLTNMKEDFNNEVEECLGPKVNKINYVFNPSWD